MTRKIIAIIAILVMVLTVACGNSQQPTSRTQGQIATSQQAVPPTSGNRGAKQRGNAHPGPESSIPGITDPTPAALLTPCR